MKCRKIIFVLVIFSFAFSLGFFVALFIIFSNDLHVSNVRLFNKLPVHAIKVAEDVYLFDSIRQTEFVELISTAINISKDKNASKDTNLDNMIWEEVIKAHTKTPPRAIVGNIIIFCDEKCNNFQIMRNDQTQLFPILEWWENKNGSDSLLVFSSPLEEGTIEPRFSGNIWYSKEGHYKKSAYWFTEQPGISNKVYYDNDGDGIFEILVHGTRNKLTKYRLNGMNYEKFSENNLVKPQNKPSDNPDIPAVDGKN
jgi:hypothetical protein